MAGGLRIDRDRIEAFTEAIGLYARQHMAQPELTPALAIDAETTLAALNFATAEQFDRLGPFGEGDPPPAVAVRDCRLLAPPRAHGRSGGTVSLLLAQGDARLRAVGFGMGELADHFAGINTVAVAGTPTINRFQGQAGASRCCSMTSAGIERRGRRQPGNNEPPLGVAFRVQRPSA